MQGGEREYLRGILADIGWSKDMTLSMARAKARRVYEEMQSADETIAKLRAELDALRVAHGSHEEP